MDREPDKPGVGGDGPLVDRIEALAAWIYEIDARVRVAEVATGDEKTAKELRRAIEALAKHDPKLEDRLTDPRRRPCGPPRDPRRNGLHHGGRAGSEGRRGRGPAP